MISCCECDIGGRASTVLAQWRSRPPHRQWFFSGPLSISLFSSVLLRAPSYHIPLSCWCPNTAPPPCPHLWSQPSGPQASQTSNLGTVSPIRQVVLWLQPLTYFPVWGGHLCCCCWKQKFQEEVVITTWRTVFCRACADQLKRGKLNSTGIVKIVFVGFFWHFVICCICVFVYLCICISVFALLT